MKLWRLILTIIAGLWTMGVAAGVANNWGEHDGTRGIVEAAGGIGAVAGMLVLTIWLATGVVKRPTPPSNT